MMLSCDLKQFSRLAERVVNQPERVNAEVAPMIYDLPEGSGIDSIGWQSDIY